MFSSLDLTAGYFQVAMGEQDQEKTAVPTPFGLHQWTRMPFGLCNAPAMFQRLMGAVLGDLVFEVLLVYLDDVLVFSSDLDSHCEKLDLVFGRLREHGLKLKPRKCFLFRTEVKFLGHVVSASGVQVDEEKVKVLEDWPVPRSVKGQAGGGLYVLLPAVRAALCPACTTAACPDGEGKNGNHKGSAPAI